jgi:hypothetical protein
VGITTPSVIAIALLTKNEQRIPQIQRFLTCYFMGYRIADDLRDWTEDLQIKNYNRSTVIHFAIGLRGGKINEKWMAGFFLNKKFRVKVYGTMKKHYLAAKKEVSDLNSPYLNEFVETQISYFEEEDEYFSAVNARFEDSIKRVLEGVVQTSPKGA